MKKANILFTVVFLLLCIGLYFLVRPQHMKPFKKPPVPVVLQTASMMKIAPQATSNGYLFSPESAAIHSKISGYISHIYFNNGAQVRKGAPLFKIYAPSASNNVKASKLRAAIQAMIYKENASLPHGYVSTQVLATDKVNMIKAINTYQNAHTAYRDTIIRAPFNGILTARQVNLGDYITNNTVLVQLVNPKKLNVRYTLPVQQIAHLKIGNKVSINHQPATISFISPIVTQQTQSVTLQATLKNSSLRPGQFVTIITPLAKSTPHIVVPQIAVLGWGNGYYVYVVKNNKAIRNPVTVGQYLPNGIEITSGLKVGQRYLIKGEHVVSVNDHVKVMTP